MQNEIVMAIDPGLRRMGVALESVDGRLLAADVVTSNSESDWRSRLKELQRAIEGYLDRYKPKHVIIEKTWPSSCRPLAVTRRVALMCRRMVTNRRISVTEVPAKTVRQLVVGWGWASKVETAQVVASIYPELQIYLRQDRAWKEHHFQNLFDAVALLIYERTSRSTS